MKPTDFWTRLLNYPLSFIIGALFLSAFSFLQKKMIGLQTPMPLNAFIVPIFLGGSAGFAIRYFYWQLHTTQGQIETFVNNIDDIVQIVDKEGRFIFVNEAWLKTFGYSSKEVKSLNISDLVHPNQKEKCKETVKNLLEHKNEIEKLHTVYLTKSGASVYLDGKMNCYMKNRKTPILRSVFRNITERKEADEFQRLVANIFEKTQEGLVITDNKQQISFVNTAFTKITGYSKEEALKKNIHQIFPLIHNENEPQEKMSVSIHRQGSWNGELWTRRKNGEIYPLKMTISEVSDPEDDVVTYACIFYDITERKENERRLEHLATHDVLTDLPNREIFYKQATNYLAKIKKTDSLLAILFLDLDGFKEVNDQYGHHVGDMLLRLVAQRLQNQTRNQDIVSRFGGDEFAVLLSNIKSEQEAISAAENILQAISAPFNVNCCSIYVTASIGISLYTDNIEFDALLIEADKAMYQAKRDGKNRISFITKGDGQSAPADVAP
jgi:two-component system CheB/CheR fusion protein